ncbi:hypothetical protein BGZ58_006156 [Dissophora ornata]|nr:hypothetical protein BGZ58_006156 [Dissophora ornata]
MGAADSKLAFKKGVFRLFEERNIPAAANDYWEQFWTLPESVDDIFLLVESQDIRRVRDEAPENLECLIEKILGRLFELCESREFLKPQAVAIQVLNCVRVLTRIFPFVFESEALRDWEELYFWPNTIPTEKRADSSEQSIVPEVVTAMNVETQLADKARSRHGQCTIEEFPEPAESAPLQGSRLIKTLLDLLFTSGFTLPTALETKTGVSYVIWETGIGSSKPIGTSKDLDDNRTEILRLLLVLFSRSMYIPPSVITTTDNPWIDAVVTGSDRQTTLAILCSLVNSALKYNPSRWGLPYNHVVLNDQRELLVMLCLQIIVVLLDYQVIAKVHSVSGNTVGRSGEHLTSADSVPTAPPPTPFPGMECESTSKNQFRYYLSRLHREQDFTFLTDGMCRILSIPMAASSTYLPGSTKQVKCHLETLTLCWKTVEINKTNRVLDIVVILLYFSLEYKQDSSHIGLVRMCACMLQTLSKDKAFGNSLNTPFEGHASLPVNVRIPNFHGTYGDYLICR